MIPSLKSDDGMMSLKFTIVAYIVSGDGIIVSGDGTTYLKIPPRCSRAIMSRQRWQLLLINQRVVSPKDVRSPVSCSFLHVSQLQL